MDITENIFFPQKKSLPLELIIEVIGEDLEKVDQEFRKNLKSEVSIISTIGEHLLFSGGKRFRPILVLLSSKLCGYRGTKHIAMASLVEFIHTATLLHDDVVDKAEIRRGVVSANSIWGNDACVLVGDFLFTKSFSLMVDNGDWKILKAISTATTLMAEGEIEELVRTNDLSITEETYLSIIFKKTASLISAATQIGAILGNVSVEEEKALYEFGKKVGMAFQLIDDKLDYTSNEEEFGKKIGIDLQEGKITLPLIIAYQRCNEDEKRFIHNTIESEIITKDIFLEIVKIIETYGGIDHTWKKANQYIEEAKKYLEIFPNSIEKQALLGLADYVLERKL
jgi:octaprenyl-diphosphate synthase